jgi:CHAT domain-containing protein
MLSSFFSFSQSEEELTDSLSYYYNNGQLQKAIPVARKIVEITGKQHNGQTTGHATALNNLAFLLNETGNKKEALEYYEPSFRLRLLLLEPDHEDCLSSAQSLANVYISLGKQTEAINLYTNYLRELGEKNKNGSAAETLIRYKRGVLYYEIDKQELAKEDFLLISQKDNGSSVDTLLMYNTYDYLVALLSNQADLAATEKIFIRFTEWNKIINGTGSEDYINSLYHLAGLYARGGQPEKSEQIMRQVVSTYEKLIGKEQDKYISAVINLVTVLSRNGKTAEAEKNLDELLSDCGSRQKNQQDPCNQLLYRSAIALIQGKNLQSAVRYLTESIDLSRKASDSVTLFQQISLLDSVYSLQNKVAERESLLRELMAIQEQKKIITDSAYSEIFISLGTVYIDLRNYAGAFGLAKKYDSLTRAIFTGDTEAYMNSRRQTAYLYSLNEQVNLSEKYYLEALRVAGKIWGEKSNRYAILLRNLGTMYAGAGLKQKASAIFLHAVSILENNKSTDYDQLAFLYQKLSQAYDRQAKDRKEEYYLIKALENAYQFPDGEVLRGILSNDLAYYYETEGRFAKADSVYLQNLKQMNQGKQSLTGDNICSDKRSYVYLITLAQQAVNLLNWGKREMAEKQIGELTQIISQSCKESSIWDERLLLYLSEYYRLTNQYPKAVELGKRMLQQQVRLMGEGNESLAPMLVILCRLFFEAGDYVAAEEVVTRLNRITLENMQLNFEVLSDAEKEKYIANKFSAQHFSNTLLLRKPDINPDFIRETFVQTLQLKSLLLSENRKITESVLKSSDTSLLRLYRTWQELRKQITKEYARPLSQRQKDISVIEERAESLQKKISSLSSGLAKGGMADQHLIAKMQENLQDDEAIIEFIYFGVFREKADSGLYAAFVLRKDSKAPVFVPLCERKELQRIFDSAGKSATQMVSRLYRGSEIKNKSAAIVLGQQLYQLVWAPLEKHLSGIKKINYSPANKLFQIAFHALPADSNTLLMDRYTLHQYISTRILADSGHTYVSKTGSITLFGDPSFDLDSTALVRSAGNNKEYVAQPLPVDRGAGNGSWIRLPGTAEEVKKIKNLFEKNQVTAASFTKEKATEENLKSLSGHSPRILHIATHGFFLPGPEKTETGINNREANVYSVSEDPLLRSGIVLAGGNRVWEGGNPIDGVEDGIATALEISQLDLSNTELVVLSACETALGDIRGNEGVFGLQRAFKMAGVKKMIMSLWQVPDKETAELMTAFYSFWLKGKAVNEAFALAQAEMRKKYSPYYWAAFVLVE